MIKNHFPNNPIVMSIGDGANDNNLLQNSHVGIELITNKKYSEQGHSGDI